MLSDAKYDAKQDELKEQDLRYLQLKKRFKDYQ